MEYSTRHSPRKDEEREHVAPEIRTASKYEIGGNVQTGEVHGTCHLAQKLGIVVAKHEQDVMNEGGLAHMITEVARKEDGCGKWLREPNVNKEKQRNRNFLQKNVAPQPRHDAINGTAYEETTADQRLPDPSPQPRTCHGGTLDLLSKPTFYVLILGAVAADYTILVVHGTIIDYALDKGVERKSAELSMTYCAATELMGRLLLPLVADFQIVGRISLVAFCFVAMAAMSLALPFTASFLSYIIVQVTTAFFLACVTTFKGVLVADNFGAKAVPTFWGANGLALIPLLSANPFITGLFRDTMGSYDNLLRLLAGIQLFTAAGFFVLAYVQKRRSKISW
ncbi:monocarboxylate transporter 10-like [Dermacentor silvarum]|uniref:monocarboxylate transporter 10-like n=1 Tax=Dermacentor silvarum TaxID=543639 RepID=UPI002101438A|nr:monocarboxylate transporter 10-like [Dermacentor silvarum]